MIEQASAHPGGHHDFIRLLKKRHKVPSNSGDLLFAQRWLAETYITDTSSSFDQFAKKLAQEWRAIDSNVRGDWRSKVDGETLAPAERLLANMPSAIATRLRRDVDSALVEYYRECRHFFVHRTDDASASAAYGKLLVRKQEVVARYARFASPLASIAHSDKTLFSRAVIRFAYQINDACAISAEMAAAWICQKRAWFGRLRKRVGADHQLEQKAMRIVRGLGIDNDQYATEVVARLVEVVTTALSKKARRHAKRSRE